MIGGKIIWLSKANLIMCPLSQLFIDFGTYHRLQFLYLRLQLTNLLISLFQLLLRRIHLHLHLIKLPVHREHAFVWEQLLEVFDYIFILLVCTWVCCASQFFGVLMEEQSCQHCPHDQGRDSGNWAMESTDFGEKDIQWKYVYVCQAHWHIWTRILLRLRL